MDLATAVQSWSGDCGTKSSVFALWLLFHLGLLVPGASVHNTEGREMTFKVYFSETQYFSSFLGHN